MTTLSIITLLLVGVLIVINEILFRKVGEHEKEMLMIYFIRITLLVVVLLCVLWSMFLFSTIFTREVDVTHTRDLSIKAVDLDSIENLVRIKK